MVWSFDSRSSNYPQSLKLSNGGATITKKDYTSNVYIFGNIGLSGEGVEWHIKIDKMQAYNELIMGIVEKDKKPGAGTANFQWSGQPAFSSSGAWAYNMTPNQFPILQQGNVVKFYYNSVKGEFKINANGNVVKNTQDLKGKVIYPFVVMYTQFNQVTVTIF